MQCQIDETDGEVQLQIDDGADLEQFIETVQLRVPNGEIIFIEDNVSFLIDFN